MANKYHNHIAIPVKVVETVEEALKQDFSPGQHTRVDPNAPRRKRKNQE